MKEKELGKIGKINNFFKVALTTLSTVALPYIASSQGLEERVNSDPVQQIKLEQGPITKESEHHKTPGNWYIKSLDGEVLAWANHWGGPGMKPVVGDYNGDGRSDLGVFDNNTGNWYIKSLDGEVLAWEKLWKNPVSTPITGDFFGNGKSDLAVKDTYGDKWSIIEMDGRILARAESWGGPGMKPVVGDYNGDGRSDMGVYNESTGEWYIKSMVNNLIAWGDKWGGPGFQPVVGDFNGDGRSDMGVYNESTGEWYIKNTGNNSIPGLNIITWGDKWGGPGFQPVVGDFNGDGKSDLSVYNESTGNWYIKSLDGEVIAWENQWGGPGFQPVVGDFNGDGRSDMGVYNNSSDKIKKQVNVGGTWYKPEEGTTSSGWKWHWGHFYLQQKGTTVWGKEKWELYNSKDVKGNVDGNRLYLENKYNPNIAFEGEIINDVFHLIRRTKTSNGVYYTRREYTKISDNIPPGYHKQK